MDYAIQPDRGWNSLELQDLSAPISTSFFLVNKVGGIQRKTVEMT